MLLFLASVSDKAIIFLLLSGYLSAFIQESYVLTHVHYLFHYQISQNEKVHVLD
jgi:hypothetical protein